MPGYVIEFDRLSGDYFLTEFGGENGYRLAMIERLNREENNHNPNIEIVSLNGANLKIVAMTHSRYFGGRQVTHSLSGAATEHVPE